MRRKSGLSPVIAIAAAIACCVPQWSPAFADEKQNASNRKIMHLYGKCIVQKHHRRAAEMITASGNNVDIMSRYTELLDSKCLNSVAGNISMTFGGAAYRYAIADALVNADYATQGPSDFTDRLPLAQFDLPDREKFEADLKKARTSEERDRMQAIFDKSTADIWLSHYGECIVRRDPLNARLWILTPPDTSEETSRITVIKPTLSECFNGGTMKFNRITIRGAVAISYYRLAVASAVPSLRKSE